MDQKREQSPVKKGDDEEDKNLFHGKDSPMKKGDTVKSGMETKKN